MHRLSLAELLLDFLVEGVARQAHENYYDGNVDDVPSVASLVFQGEVDYGGKEALARILCADARSLVELPDDRNQDKDAKRE